MDDLGTIAASIAIVLLLGSVVGVFMWDRRASIRQYMEHRRQVRIDRGVQMGKKQKEERLAYLKGKWGDAITEFGEEEFFAGRMTRDEVNAFYRAIGTTCKLPDVLPTMTQSQLKVVIKKRRSHGTGVSAGPIQEKPSWGPNPKEDVPVDSSYKPSNVINAKKSFGDKALRLLKTG